MKPISRKNKVKSLLREGKKAIGTFCVSHSPAIFETLAGCGMEYLVVDTEHFMVNPETIEQCIIAIEASGTTPFVRVQENTKLIDRCISAGARGVVIPMINTKTQAQEAVDVIKYRPLGKRGVCNPRAITYGTLGLKSMLDFYQRENEQIMCIIMLETEEAFHNLPEILQVSGVDSILIGRFDLTHSMGITGQFEHPKVTHIIKNTLKMAHKSGISVGINTFNGEDSNHFIEMGFDWIDMSCDMLFLSQSIRTELAKIKR